MSFQHNINFDIVSSRNSTRTRHHRPFFLSTTEYYLNHHPKHSHRNNGRGQGTRRTSRHHPTRRRICTLLSILAFPIAVVSIDLHLYRILSIGHTNGKGNEFETSPRFVNAQFGRHANGIHEVHRVGCRILVEGLTVAQTDHVVFSSKRRGRPRRGSGVCQQGTFQDDVAVDDIALDILQRDHVGVHGRKGFGTHALGFRRQFRLVDGRRRFVRRSGHQYQGGGSSFEGGHGANVGRTVSDGHPGEEGRGGGGRDVVEVEGEIDGIGGGIVAGLDGETIGDAGGGLAGRCGRRRGIVAAVVVVLVSHFLGRDLPHRRKGVFVRNPGIGIHFQIAGDVGLFLQNGRSDIGCVVVAASRVSANSSHGLVALNQGEEIVVVVGEQGVIAIDLELIVSESFSGDVEYERPMQGVLDGNVIRCVVFQSIGRVAHHAHDEVLRGKVLLPPLLDQFGNARSVLVGVVDVLIPEVLDVGIVAAFVEEPIGSDVADDGEIDGNAFVDFGGVRFSRPKRVGDVVAITEEVHHVPQMQHGGHVIRLILPTSQQPLLGEVRIDVLFGTGTLADGPQHPLLIDRVAPLPILIERVIRPSLGVEDHLVGVRRHGMRFVIGRPFEGPHVRRVLGGRVGTAGAEVAGGVGGLVGGADGSRGDGAGGAAGVSRLSVEDVVVLAAAVIAAANAVRNESTADEGLTRHSIPIAIGHARNRHRGRFHALVGAVAFPFLQAPARQGGVLHAVATPLRRIQIQIQRAGLLLAPRHHDLLRPRRAAEFETGRLAGEGVGKVASSHRRRRRCRCRVVLLISSTSSVRSAWQFAPSGIEAEIARGFGGSVDEPLGGVRAVQMAVEFGIDVRGGRGLGDAGVMGRKIGRGCRVGNMGHPRLQEETEKEGGGTEESARQCVFRHDGDGKVRK
mmetsp:Transcript_30593/g.64489  ORF Transcript_30593/g.64489 Transcript_30593/m.64489 type:complete len:905 (-) Transcript_30593:208-2922(-)